MTSHKDIHEAVRRVVYQLPNPELGVRTLVVVCPHIFPPINTLELVGAMLSLPKVNLVTRKVTYSLEGIAQPDEYTRVRAVARYDENPENLALVHNPFARTPIDPKRFEGLPVRQFIPNDNGAMRWI
jgi:hypothetical protein